MGVSYMYERAVQTGHAITMQEITADFKYRMRGVCRDAEFVDPNTHNNKLATCNSWFAIPFSRNERKPINVPRYLHLDLCESYVLAVQTGRAIPMQEFTADLKHRMRGVGETLSWWTPTRTTTN